MTELLAAFEGGKRTALARAISIVENRREGYLDLLSALHSRQGRAHRIGITGPPGAGKSTLSSSLIQHFRAHDETVGVIAVDPTSPFTGGALLGDRIRMNDVSMDENVFVRSMATRGSLGGIAITTKEIADVMDAFGFDRVIIETVGVGQSELDVAAAADTTLVVLVPESGDSIQAMKAGLMEIADIFDINKSDRPGADRVAREIDMMLHLRLGNAMKNVPAHHGVIKRKSGLKGDQATGRSSDGAAWSIPVLQTVAETGKGVPELAAALDKHRAWMEQSGEIHKRRRSRLAERVKEAVERRLHDVAWREKGGQNVLDSALDDLEGGKLTPYAVADRIVSAVIG
ncbi:MAG TPA: methylmalonyl Co-A mutase-associated GTPase MeaB [Longimicrobiales bacterium]|nr:methylmalonyl Co-A mutase-associated GTPase MeaB [Longimicrobiales bacterium]